ncbi:non-ribosomal peptide synthetase, partial [Chamaesiphon polymorphus]
MSEQSDRRIALLSPTQFALSEHKIALENQVAEKYSILRFSDRGYVRLSFAQQRLWFLSLLNLGNSICNRPANIHLKGQLDVRILEKCLNEIIHRHQVIRSNFVSVGGHPEVAIVPKYHLSLNLTDLSSMAIADRENNLQKLLHQFARYQFDLERDFLMQVGLVKIQADEHMLLLTFHRAIFDDCSMEVLSNEITILYDAFSQDKISPLLDLEIQYSDFANWQIDRLEHPSYRSKLDYWKKQLGGELPLLSLPLDRPRPPMQTFQGARYTHAISLELTTAIKQFSQREQTTLFMTLLAVYQVLLYRYSGQTDIIVGTPISGRDRLDVEHLIGVFTNLLALRSKFTADDSFRSVLARVRQVALAAYEHQEMPFEKLVEELHLERNLSYSPLFQTIFQLRQPSKVWQTDTGLYLQQNQTESGTIDVDLYLDIVETPTGLVCNFEYNTNLFDRATIERMARHFEALLNGILVNPDKSISEIGLFSESERQELAACRNRISPKRNFNNLTKSEIQQSIATRFQKQVKQYPDRLAVIANNEQWTYRQLDREANSIATELIKYTQPTQIRVALLFDRNAPAIAAILAVLKIGLVYVPLDSSYPRSRLAYMLADAMVTVLLTDNTNLELARSLVDRQVQIVNIDDLDRDREIEAIDLEIAADTIAYLLYTSGSTGQPKGVIQTHRNVLHFIRNYTNNLHINCEDRLTLLAPFSSDATVIDLFGGLLNGATLCMFDLKQAGLVNFSQWLRSQAITIYHSTPTVYRYAIEATRDRLDLAQIRAVVLGGELAVKQDVELYREYFDDRCLFVNGLGCTESSFHLQYLIDKETITAQNNVSVGYPFDDTEILLLSSDGKLTDIMGEIAVRSPHLALGYWRQPELTQSVFLPDPDGTERRIYRTGDWGYLRTDGSLECLGRKDSQVKIRGFRVELGEIEAVLSQHPDVLQTIAIARENGNGDKSLIAYVVPKNPTTFISRELRQFLTQKLPSYSIPARFVVLAELPLTPNGKIDRRALPALDSHSDTLERAYVKPCDELELQLTTIWERVLGIHQVGIEDNFFDLGGNSLMTVKIVAEIERELAKRLAVATLFQAQTIKQLAIILRQERYTAGWNSLVPLQAKGTKPPLFLIHPCSGEVSIYRSLCVHMGV